LIFNTVTLSFDWLEFAVKLVWRAAENCAYLIACAVRGLEPRFGNAAKGQSVTKFKCSRGEKESKVEAK